MENGVVVIGLRSREIDKKNDDCFGDKDTMQVRVLEA